MKKIKPIEILWLSPFSPISSSVEGGGQTFNYYFKRFQQDERFRIRFISSGLRKQKDTIESENSSIPHVVAYPAENLKQKVKKLVDLESRYNPFNRNANLLSNFYIQLALSTMRRWKRDGYCPDIVIFEWTSTLVLTPKVRKIFPHAKFVASEHDVTFVGYKRKRDYYKGVNKLIWTYKYGREKRLELRGLKMCDLVLLHNIEHSEYIKQEGVKEEKIQWLVPYYNNMTSNIRDSKYQDILFFGAMSRPENYLSAIWFIEYVMPLIKDINLRFVILGSNPPDNLKRLECERVHVTGYVKSIEPYFKESMCLAAPLVLGAGIKIKILEALSSGIPVLTNDIGIEGIPAKAGMDYFHCTQPSDYERMIRAIYERTVSEKEIEMNSKNFMLKNFSPEKSFEHYKDKLIELGEEMR